MRGSSNLSVDKISVFNSLSNDVLPCNRVYDIEQLVNSSNLQSVLFKVLRKIYRSSLNVGQWNRKWEVNSISKPQLHTGYKQSWNFCLSLCSCRWFIPTRSPVIGLITSWLLQLKTLLGEGLINFRLIFMIWNYITFLLVSGNTSSFTIDLNINFNGKVIILKF